MNRLPQYLLVGIAVVAVGGLHVVGHYSGTFDHLDERGKDGTYPLPFRPQRVHDFLSSFVAFFYPAVDGNHPGYSLACYIFAGQWMAGWHLIMLEGFRPCNQGKLIAHTTLFGLLYQVLGLGFLLPLYLALHLAAVSIKAKDTTHMPEITLKGLTVTPIALVFGYFVPTVAMSLPTSIASAQFKRLAILFWQPFPLWCNLLSSGVCWALDTYPRSWPNTAHPLTRLRIAYTVPITFAAVAQISAFTIALSSVVSPWIIDSWSKAQLASALLSFPPTPFSVVRAEHDSAQGLLWFIQWDYMTSSFAIMVWAATLDTVYWKPSTGIAFARRLASLAASAVFFGPMGASALVLWQRDENTLRKGLFEYEAQKRLKQESTEYEVEAILDERKVGNETQFFVRWAGWSSEHNTWEPIANLTNARDLIAEYRSSHQGTRSLRSRKTPARQDHHGRP
jgi:hypothetical protein